jgi:hypothetical protein
LPPPVGTVSEKSPTGCLAAAKASVEHIAAGGSHLGIATRFRFLADVIEELLEPFAGLELGWLRLGWKLLALPFVFAGVIPISVKQADEHQSRQQIDSKAIHAPTGRLADQRALAKVAQT